MSPSGHAIVKDHMRQYNAQLGGELSCHFFFMIDYFGYDDGIYAMLRLLVCCKIRMKLLMSSCVCFLQNIAHPKYALRVPMTRSMQWWKQCVSYFKKRPDVTLVTIDGARVSTNYGWGIVRVSNTQPALSMRFEADSPEGLIEIKKEFLAALAHYFDMTILKKELGL